MSMTDSIADMLTRIRNGQNSKLMSVLVPNSKKKVAILDVLKDEGYILGYVISEKKRISQIEVLLKYSISGKAGISQIHRVSKPGKRIYSSINDLRGFYNNMGIYILFTSKGVLSDREAHIQNVGGEVICKVF